MRIQHKSPDAWPDQLAVSWQTATLSGLEASESPVFPAGKDDYGAPEEKGEGGILSIFTSPVQDLPGSLVITLLGATLLIAIVSTTLCQQRGFPTLTVKSPVSTLIN